MKSKLNKKKPWQNARVGKKKVEKNLVKNHG
jgi:hypothetical protein